MKNLVEIKNSRTKYYIVNLFGKKIVANFFYLSILQVANYALPFVIIPHLIQVLGFEKIGIIYMAQALMTYLTMLTDYGFNLTATKFISLNKSSKIKVDYIFNAVISTKLFLLGLAFVILLILIAVVPLFHKEALLFFLSYALVIGSTLFPVWFFQGIEEMKYISIINFTSRIIFTVSIFFFINQKADYVRVNLLQGAGSLISTFLAFYIIARKYTVTSRFRVRYVKTQLNEGWHIFVSNLAISLYMYSNIFLLGIFADKTTLGFFGVADKCIQGMRQLLVVFYQVIYPKACAVAKESHLMFILFFKKVFYKFLLFVVFCSVCIFLLAPFITFLLTKSYQPQVVNLLRIMCFVPVVVALNIPCNQSIIIYHIKKSYTVVIVIGTIINILSNLILARLFGAYGTATAIYITESFVTISLYFILQYTMKGRYSLSKLFSL